MGIGNLLCSDDGVGVHALRVLSQNGLPVCTVDAGTAILHALPFVEEATHLLVIDAVRAGESPGTVHEYDGYEMENAGDLQSLHSFGLKQAMEFIAPDRRPAVFRVLGVEPAVVEYGTELSGSVRTALPNVVEHASRVVFGWISSGESEQL